MLSSVITSGSSWHLDLSLIGFQFLCLTLWPFVSYCCWLHLLISNQVAAFSWQIQQSHLTTQPPHIWPVPGHHSPCPLNSVINCIFMTARCCDGFSSLTPPRFSPSQNCTQTDGQITEPHQAAEIHSPQPSKWMTHWEGGESTLSTEETSTKAKAAAEYTWTPCWLTLSVGAGYWASLGCPAIHLHQIHDRTPKGSCSLWGSFIALVCAEVACESRNTWEGSTFWNYTQHRSFAHSTCNSPNQQIQPSLDIYTVCVCSLRNVCFTADTQAACYIKLQL